MKPIAIISVVIVILIIATLIGLSIYYNVKTIETPIPTTIPELLGFKTSSNKKTSENFISLGAPEYFGIAIAGIFVFVIITYGLFVFLPDRDWSAVR